MIISEEQVRRSVQYIESSDASTGCRSHYSPAASGMGVIERVMAVVAQLPDVRVERVQQARTLIEHGLPASAQVADKLVGRAISDSLR